MENSDFAMALAAFMLLRRRRKANELKRSLSHRKCWVNPYLLIRGEKGRFKNDFQIMIYTPAVFYQNCHMSETCFKWLFNLVEPHMVAKRNTRPDAIPLKAKFAMVLEYFATGDLQNVSRIYRISPQHVGRTIDLVCNAICIVLKDEIPTWTQENMLMWANDFMDKWNFPNTVGAIDGKHIAIVKPPNSGSAFYNYKGFFSIVLMAVCDASYSFTYIDVGAYGSEGDMSAFSHCSLGKAIMADSLPFPPDHVLNGVATPYFIVADDAFPLHKRIMKPYGSRSLSVPERIFNYRLSRGHRCIENAFGILTAKWMAVQRTLRCHPERAQKVASACCYLHNLLMRLNPFDYRAQDQEAYQFESTPDLGSDSIRGRLEDYPKFVRNNIKEYVNSSQGSVPWQNNLAGV